MPIVLGNNTEVADFLDTEVTATTRTVTTADSAPTGDAGVATQHASFVTFGLRNFVSVTAATFQVWVLTGNQWTKLQVERFNTADSLLRGPVEIQGADRVFLQVESLTGTSLDMAYLVHDAPAPTVREDRPEAVALNNSSSTNVDAPANFQVFVPYDSDSLGMSVENDVGLNAVLTVEREDSGFDGDDSTTGFALSTVNTPIVSGFAGMVTVIATISSTELTMSDDGAGNLSGAAGTGTVTSYALGTMSVTFSSPPDNLTDILITYTYDV